MGIINMRQMKWVVNKMEETTKKLEKKLDIFIDNQNDLAKMVATNYLMLGKIAEKAEINKEEFPKPLIKMELE